MAYDPIKRIGDTDIVSLTAFLLKISVGDLIKFFRPDADPKKVFASWEELGFTETSLLNGTFDTFAYFCGNEMLAIGCLSSITDAHARVAVVVAPEYREKGIGMSLLRRLLLEARKKGYEKLSATFPKEAHSFCIFLHTGFSVIWSGACPLLFAEYDLSKPERS